MTNTKNKVLAGVLAISMIASAGVATVNAVAQSMHSASITAEACCDCPNLPHSMQAEISIYKNLFKTEVNVEEFITTWLSNDNYLEQFPVVLDGDDMMDYTVDPDSLYPYEVKKLKGDDEYIAKNYTYLYYASLTYAIDYVLDRQADCIDIVGGARAMLDKLVANKESMMNLLDAIDASDYELTNVYVVENFVVLNEGLVECFDVMGESELTVSDFYQSMHNDLCYQIRTFDSRSDISIDPNLTLRNLDKKIFTTFNLDVANLNKYYNEWLNEDADDLLSGEAMEFPEVDQEDENYDSIMKSYYNKYLIYSLNTAMLQFKGYMSAYPLNVDFIKCFINEVPPVAYEALDLCDAIYDEDYANVITLAEQVKEDLQALIEKMYDGYEMDELYFAKQQAMLKVYDQARYLWKNGKVNPLVLNKIKHVEKNINTKTTQKGVQTATLQGIEYVNSCEVLNEFISLVEKIKNFVMNIIAVMIVFF